MVKNLKLEGIIRQNLGGVTGQNTIGQSKCLVFLMNNITSKILSLFTLLVLLGESHSKNVTWSLMFRFINGECIF